MMPTVFGYYYVGFGFKPGFFNDGPDVLDINMVQRPELNSISGPENT